MQGAEVNLLGYVGEVISGFAAVYRLLARHRDELVSEGGPVARFSGDEVRYIARDSQAYAMLMEEGLHPDMLRDALDRDRFFDNLWAVEEGPKLTRLFAHECADLRRGDIPMFIARPDSRDLWNASGQHVPDYLSDSGLELARRRILQLDEEDLARQTWFIRASFTALVMGEGRDQWPTYDPPERGARAEPAELLEAARKIGDRLELLALRGDRDASWLGVTLVNDRAWFLLPSGTDLYDGLSGIALFLGYLGHVSGEQQYTSLADAAVETILREWERVRSDQASNTSEDSKLVIGAFHELGGTIYALTHLGVLWDQPELLDEAEGLTEFLPSLIETDKNFDIISGAAGCIKVLLNLHGCRPSRRMLSLASRCGDHLLAHALPMDRGLGWGTSAGPQPLTGFSHGAAGMAHALLELAAATGQSRFRETALEAMTYERRTFSPEAENWPDLRDPEKLGRTDEDVDRFPAVWCYGAPGIGLARLHALRHLDEPELRAEVGVALKTTFGEGFGVNHSLCHGALGNLDLPLEAARVFGDASLLGRVYATAAGILESFDERGWLCGIPSGVETPGLMTGLAGIGYGLLRLVEPRRVPSVLLVEPPRLDLC